MTSLLGMFSIRQVYLVGKDLQRLSLLLTSQRSRKDYPTEWTSHTELAVSRSSQPIQDYHA